MGWCFVAVWQAAMAESIMDLKDLKMPKPQVDPKQVMDMIMGFQKSQVGWSVAIGHYIQMCHKHGIHINASISILVFPHGA